MTPEVYRFGFQEVIITRSVVRKKERSADHSPQTRHGAQVAPQRCPILRTGKALTL